MANDMMPDKTPGLQLGERVRLSIDCRFHYDNGGTCVFVIGEWDGTEPADERSLLVLDSAHVAPMDPYGGAAKHPVEWVRNIPRDGIPKPGDIWKDRNGCLYWVAGDARYAERLVLVNAGGYNDGWVNVHRGIDGPIDLVHRPAPRVETVQLPAEDVPPATMDGA